MLQQMEARLKPCATGVWETLWQMADADSTVCLAVVQNALLPHHMSRVQSLAHFIIPKVYASCAMYQEMNFDEDEVAVPRIWRLSRRDGRPWWKKTATMRNSTHQNKCKCQNKWECGTSHLQEFSFPGQAQQWINPINHKFCLFRMGRLPIGEFYFITDPCDGDQVADAEEDAWNFSYFKPNKYDASSVWEDVSLSAWRKSPVVDSARCSALSFGSTPTFPLGAPYGSTLLKKWICK
jgi:hypothetical protein